MIPWALAFFVLAAAAALFGFGDIIGQTDFAKIVFFVSMMLFSVATVVGLLRVRTPTM